jgi:hypothetical protein
MPQRLGQTSNRHHQPNIEIRLDVVGDYQGDRIEIQGSSQLSALSRWQEAARGKGTFNKGSLKTSSRIF